MLPFAFSNPFIFPQYLPPAVGLASRDSKFPTQLVSQRLPPPLRSQTPSFFRPRETVRFPLPLQPPPPPSSFHPAYVAAAAALYQQYVDTYRRNLASVVAPPPLLPISDATAANKKFGDDKVRSLREIVAVNDPNISKTKNVSDTLLQERFDRLKNESKLEDVTIICEKNGNAWSDSRDRTDLDDTISFDLNGRRFKRKLSDSESLRTCETKKTKGKMKKLEHDEKCDKNQNKRISSPLRKQSSRRYKFASLQIGDFHFESSADCQLSHVGLYHRLNQMIYEFNYKRNFGVKSQDACCDDESTDDHQYHHREHDHSSPKVRQVLNVVVTIIVPLNSIQRLMAIDTKTISLEINETPRIITRLQDREQWSKIFGHNSYMTTIDVTDGQLEVSRRHTIVLARCTCASMTDFFAYFEPHIIYEEIAADKCSSPPILYDICSPREIDLVENSQAPLNGELSNPDVEKHDVAASVKLVVDSILGRIE